LRLGTAELEAHKPEAARASLSRSARVAIRSGNTTVAAEALARRMWIVADPLGQPEVGLADADVAGGFVDGQHELPRLRWLFHNNHGVALFRSGDVPAAERAYRDALSVLEGNRDTYPVEFISTGYNLATLLATSARPAAAAQELGQVREQAVGLLGVEHPRVAVITVELALTLGDIGRRDQALAKLDDSFALLGPADTYLRSSHHTAYANLSLYTRDYAEAYRHAEAAVSIMAEFPSHQHKIQARALKSLTGISFGGVDMEAGLRELRAAAREVEATFGRDHEGAGHAHWWLGRGLRAAGRIEDAIGEFARANEIYGSLGSGASALVGLHGMELAEAHLARGDFPQAGVALGVVMKAQDTAGLGDQNVYRLALQKLRGDLALAQNDSLAAAREFAETCPAMAANRDEDDPDLAQCRLSWSQSLGPTREGRKLANQARAAFKSLGAGFASERLEAERLLRDVATQAPSSEN
ncbi:MAG: hypothetical protein ACPG4T_18640, partial [Nannocystaceae bacterium]